MEEVYPGCLFASYIYEANLFDAETLAVAGGFLMDWRRKLGARLREAARLRPPKEKVDPDELADGLTVAFEGAMIVSKMLKDPKAIAAHLRHYRRYLELLFGGA
jgi:TetR/AcrR family transcriptional repressor of nem operon